MAIDRRRFLYAGLAASFGGIAGCAGDSESSPTAATNSPTASQTPTPEATPGADILGGSGDLRSSATVRAASLDSDRGAGQFVFTPAVVWVESGATVTWNIEGSAHSVTAYHDDNDKPHRVPEDAAAFDSGTLEAGTVYDHTFETPGVYNYYCTPHESLGMTGVVIVDDALQGPGTAPLSELSGTPATRLERQLTQVAGISLSEGGDDTGSTYGWQAATWDSYWYSLYNMSTNIAMSANGITFPANDEQQAVFEERLPAMLQAAGEDRPPVKDPNLNMAPFTSGDPHFTETPVLQGEDGRPDASTLRWDESAASNVVSPASVAWTHLKGVTWAKNFQNHADILPDALAAEFRSEMLATLAQLGTKFALVDGNLRANEENMLLVSGFNPMEGVVEEGPDPGQHAAMLWFLGDMVSLATGGWFGYENPEPLIPAENIQQLTDGLGKTVMNAVAPEDLPTTRDVGELLAAVGWYGTHAGSSEMAGQAAAYADALAGRIEDAIADDGRIADGADNQAATQGIAAQGLVWASQIDGVDHTATAEEALGYLVDALYDEDAGTFRSGMGETTYTITARDAGDITGGLNAADAELGMDVREVYARFFDQTFNRGRLQRARRGNSPTDPADAPPAPPEAGGEHGQAAVYNAEVEYDADAEEWSVTDPSFDTEAVLYLANQDIWMSHWGGEFYQGRGVPGKNDEPT